MIFLAGLHRHVFCCNLWILWEYISGCQPSQAFLQSRKEYDSTMENCYTLLSTGVANAVFSFLTMIVMGYLFDWKARDLIWGFWLSSLCLGLVVFVAKFIVWPLSKAKNGNARVAALAGGGALLAIFTFHYGIFHFVHSAFLSKFFPINAKWPSMEMYEKIILTYWPIALITLWAAKDLFLRPGEPQKEGKEKKFNPMSVYKNVVKTHFLIFALAPFAVSSLDSFWVYAVVCVFYIFPYKELKSIWTKK
jgi:hypothetical protein